MTGGSKGHFQKQKNASVLVDAGFPYLGFPRPAKKPLVRYDPHIFTLPKNSNPF